MKFLIDSKVYAKVMHLVNLCDKEISGLGKVKIEGNIVRITDMYLLDQEVTGATTDITADAVSTCLYEAYKDGLHDGEILWWWHSHVNMGVFWSGTDMATIKEFGKQGRFFATVFNKKAEMKSAYFQAPTQMYPECFVDNIETLIDFGLSKDEIADLDNQFKAKVKEKKWTMPKTLMGDTDIAKFREKHTKKGKGASKKEIKKILADPYGVHDDHWPVSFFDDDYWEDDYLNHNTHGYKGVGLRAGTDTKKGSK